MFLVGIVMDFQSNTSNKKLKSKDITKLEIRNLCKEYAMKFVNKQKEEFIRLGVVSDWNNPYLTINPSFEANQISVFSDMFLRDIFTEE